ncbi:hypothetical protein SHKM778_58540 [Streptomyces sp. KM77-8]|uniref:Uncharacterized protein n=1 Tax=Streptomyces haneummycinicus TaxID=3074435 RepID=A0AAT9HQW4_9ACTN
MTYEFLPSALTPPEDDPRTHPLDPTTARTEIPVHAPAVPAHPKLRGDDPASRLSARTRPSGTGWRVARPDRPAVAADAAGSPTGEIRPRVGRLTATYLEPVDAFPHPMERARSVMVAVPVSGGYARLR